MAKLLSVPRISVNHSRMNLTLLSFASCNTFCLLVASKLPPLYSRFACPFGTGYPDGHAGWIWPAVQVRRRRFTLSWARCINGTLGVAKRPGGATSSAPPKYREAVDALTGSRRQGPRSSQENAWVGDHSKRGRDDRQAGRSSGGASQDGTSRRRHGVRCDPAGPAGRNRREPHAPGTYRAARTGRSRADLLARDGAHSPASRRRDRGQGDARDPDARFRADAGGGGPLPEGLLRGRRGARGP